MEQQQNDRNNCDQQKQQEAVSYLMAAATEGKTAAARVSHHGVISILDQLSAKTPQQKRIHCNVTAMCEGVLKDGRKYNGDVMNVHSTRTQADSEVTGPPDLPHTSSVMSERVSVKLLLQISNGLN